MSRSHSLAPPPAWTPSLEEAQVGEISDAQALASWLWFVHQRNADTHRSYQAEAMRFWAFLKTRHGNNPTRSQPHLMRDASEADVLAYEAQLAGRVKSGSGTVPMMRVDPAVLAQAGISRQPFIVETGPKELRQQEPIALKDSSVNQALSILHALYQYWMQPDPVTRMAYVGANPTRRIKRSSNRMQRQTERNFPIEAVTAMMHAIQVEMDSAEATEGGRNLDIKRLQRRRWIVAALFGLWARRSELTQISMRDFRHNGKRWMVQLQRKGGKTQTVPVAPWVMDELARYRISLGKSPLPTQREVTPAIERLRKREHDRIAEATGSDCDLPGAQNLVKGVHGDTIYTEVTEAAQLAARRLRSGIVLPQLDLATRERVADLLEQVSPHWFRHSGASIAINAGAMSLENASKMLGHSSTTITAEMYYHPDEDQIADGMQKMGDQAFGASNSAAPTAL